MIWNDGLDVNLKVEMDTMWDFGLEFICNWVEFVEFKILAFRLYLSSCKFQFWYGKYFVRQLGM